MEETTLVRKCLIALVGFSLAITHFNAVSHPVADQAGSPTLPHAKPEWEKDGSRVIYDAFPRHSAKEASRDIVVTVSDVTGTLTPATLAVERVSQDIDARGYADLQQPFLPNSRHSLLRSQRADWIHLMPVHMNGELKFRLPPGRYVIHLSKGLEFKPLKSTIDVQLGSLPLRVDLQLERLFDLRRLGWWSGDPHVHIERMSTADNEEIFWAAQGQDLNVVSLLAMGDRNRIFFPQYAMGAPGSANEGDYWLHPGQEDPRTADAGHLIVLNAPTLIRDRARYRDYIAVARAARDAKAVIGIAHFKQNESGSMSAAEALLPLGLADFIEILGLPYGFDPNQYFAYLNRGYRIGVTGGSDFPWGGALGDARTYALLGPGVPLTPSTWYEAVRKGRTFATDGPLIDFRIDGAPIGSVLNASVGTEVEVEAKAMTNAFNPNFERLDVYANGELIRSQPFAPTSVDREATLAFRHRVVTKTWFVFVARQRDRAVAISSPIYVDIKQ